MHTFKLFYFRKSSSLCLSVFRVEHRSKSRCIEQASKRNVAKENNPVVLMFYRERGREMDIPHIPSRKWENHTHGVLFIAEWDKLNTIDPAFRHGSGG